MEEYKRIARARPLIPLFVLWTVALMIASGCKTARRDFEAPPPSVPSEVIAFEAAPWGEVDRAVNDAAAEVGMAVIEQDRWRLGVVYTLRTERGQPGTLLVTGDPEQGAAAAEARVGRFRRADLEMALLEALRTALQER
ncbi:MAG: hypothetical protein ACF8PN_14660 [Phycisphaerales bacterium]